MPTVPVKAAGWRIEPPVSLAVAARQSCAATADAEPPEEPPGVSRPRLSPAAPRRLRLRGAPVRRQPGRGDGAVVRGLVGRAHRELVHVELAQHHRAVAPQMRGDGRFVGRREAVEDVAARLRMDALGGVEILDAERQAFERAGLAAREPRVARLAPSASARSGVTATKALRPLALLDRVEIGAGQFDAGERLGAQRVARLRASGVRSVGIGHEAVASLIR